MITLAGKGAIIVGARRVGRSVALRLAREQCGLAIAYRRSRVEADALAQEAAVLGGKVTVVQGDLAQEEDVVRMVAEASKALGSLHFVVNLASDFERVPFDQLDAPAWDRAMAQAKGSYLLSIHASRRMAANRGPTRGHIVLFGDSSAIQTPYRDYLPYLTAKATINFMTRALALELAATGILVNAIAPGPTLRPADLDPELWQGRVVGRTPLKREASPEEIAEMVATLLKSETITGETIRIDAGVHLAGHGPAS